MKRLSLVLLVLVLTGCAGPKRAVPTHATREVDGIGEMFLKTDKYSNGKWFPIVTETGARCLQHIPPTLTPGMIVAIRSRGLSLVPLRELL